MRAEIRIWWDQATADLRTSEVNLRADCYYASVFFAQQAVEKALKALVLKKKRKLPCKEAFRWLTRIFHTSNDEASFGSVLTGR